MTQTIDSKRIVKNTLFMYFRMILLMGVTLYTSRVVLDKLGVDDYSIYNVIFSLIGILSFLNGTLSLGTSRFLTFELGANNHLKLTNTFSTVLAAHIALALVIFIIGETIGLWYVNNVLVVDASRLDAAKIVYQVSIISTCITILQVPYTSCVIAHEKMKIYAYVGMFEAIGRLLVVFLLDLFVVDRLVLFAFLTMLVQLVVMLMYVIFSIRLFDETRYLRRPDLDILKNIINFSGWNILAKVSNTLLSEGVILLFNIFFQPFVVAAQGISKQLSSAIMTFINNIRIAVEPQITKLYASGSYKESQKLTLKSAELTFYLLLVLGVPCIIVMPEILNIWLLEVPEYTVAFARLIIIQNIFGHFNAAFYAPMTAANKIKKNSISGLIICLTQFLVIYILFKVGFGPLWARYIGIIAIIVFSYIVKPYILYKDLGYSLRELYVSIFQCLKVGFIVAICSFFIYWFVPTENILGVLLSIILTVFMIFGVVILLIDESYRKVIFHWIKSNLQ